jgi:Secretion system C-terminal sorting domain/FG-GAP-like repeat
MNKAGIVCVLVLIALLPAVLHAQYQGRVFDKDTSIRITVNGQQRAMAWCGGFNNPQIAMGDLNQDGKNDLIIYERYVGIRTFINTGTPTQPHYLYVPKYEKNFPTVNAGLDTLDYLVLADYNRDGTPDLFMRGTPGYDVSKGYYNSNHELCFTHYKGLYYNNDQNGLGNINAYCNPGDIPSIVDIDNDGDLDFVSYMNGGTFLYLYKNLQMEMSLPNDSIHVELKDKCWGKVLQGNDRTHQLGVTCNNTGLRPGAGAKTTHSGNTCTLIDMDGDGDYDYLDGNISFNDMVFLRNGKAQYGKDSMIAQDTTWQGAGKKVNLPQWPVAFSVDIDQDGLYDIVVAPNTNSSSSENYKCIWYYRNTGTSTNPNFVFQSDTLLVSNTIDLGRGAYPMLYDYDKDGKLDLFIGSDGYFMGAAGLRSRMSYYKNTSAGSNLSFALQTTDFMNMSTLNYTGAAPAVGDIDGDGKDDLLIGHSDGTVSYYTNMAANASATPQWQKVTDTLKNSAGTMINVGGYAAPCIYDIDKDGKKDLILGGQLGKLYYYQNTNTVSGQVSLLYKTNALGGIVVNPNDPFSGYCTPYIGKMDNTGNDYIVCGSGTGDIYRYTGFQNGNTTSAYARLDSQYAMAYPMPRSAPIFADLDNDGMYEMIVGNVLGGVMLYKQQFPVHVNSPELPNESLELHVYPNPAKNVLYADWVNGAVTEDKHIIIYNVTGQVIQTMAVDKNETHATIDVQNLTAGWYWVVLKGKDLQYVSKVVVMPR